MLPRRWLSHCLWKCWRCGTKSMAYWKILIVGRWLDWIDLEVFFFNLNCSMIPWKYRIFTFVPIGWIVTVSYLHQFWQLTQNCTLTVIECYRRKAAARSAGLASLPSSKSSIIKIILQVQHPFFLHSDGISHISINVSIASCPICRHYRSLDPLSSFVPSGMYLYC